MKSFQEHLFRTEVSVPKASFELTYSDGVLTLGSCFTEHMGRQLQRMMFRSLVNPFGQLYNPASLKAAALRMVSGEEYREEDLFEHDGLWHSADHHTRYSGVNKAEVLNRINLDLKEASLFIRSAGMMIITLGTAHVFRRKSDELPVANCHKMPPQLFQSGLMESYEVTAALQELIQVVRSVNPSLKFILSISPVRYMAFGAFENNLSKARLFEGVYAVLKSENNIYYFPSYELVMDELRDYRFYAEDMLHPNHQTTRFIWEKLISALTARETRELMKEVEEVIRAAEHRPRNPESDAHRSFVLGTLQKIGRLERLVPGNLNELRQKLQRSTNPSAHNLLNDENLWHESIDVS